MTRHTFDTQIYPIKIEFSKTNHCKSTVNIAGGNRTIYIKIYCTLLSL